MNYYIKETQLNNKGKVIKEERITGNTNDLDWAKQQLDYRTNKILKDQRANLVNGCISTTSQRSQIFLKDRTVIIEIVEIKPIDARTLLIAIVIKYNGNWDRVMQAVQQRERPEDTYLEKANNLQCKTVTLLDQDYPDSLRHMVKPPFVLFYYGNLNLIKDYKKNVSIVGTRNPSSYGKRVTLDITKGLADKGYTLVSGMSLGVSTIVHETCCSKRNRKTVAVLPCGIDYCYPQENRYLYTLMKGDHLVISELPGLVEPEPTAVLTRNRIIAGLSKTLVITEAKEGSGNVKAVVQYALTADTNVLCVPDRAGQDSFCNYLIAEGAGLVENTNDIIELMAL